jgi:hypothetical protein
VAFKELPNEVQRYFLVDWSASVLSRFFGGSGRRGGLTCYDTEKKKSLVFLDKMYAGRISFDQPASDLIINFTPTCELATHRPTV